MSFQFTFTDIFAGVGGFHIALHELGGKLTSAIERDKSARITYKTNFITGNEDVFSQGKFFEDIRNVNPENIPHHDILCAGFPCQAFSIAGYRKGFQDDRGNLFFDLRNIIRIKSPKVIFLENVKNLKTHDNGNTFTVIIKKLEELGYYIKYKVMNSSEFGGIPQNRERIYIVGFKDLSSFNNFIFPSPIGLTNGVQDFLEKSVPDLYYYTNKPLYSKIKDYILEKNKVYQRRRKYVRENKNGVCPTLTANMGTGGHNVPIIVDDNGIRKMTPKECFSLQGFPDNFILPNISLGQLYKQAGNAVSVPVIKRICENILIASGMNYKKSLSFNKICHVHGFTK